MEEICQECANYGDNCIPCQIPGQRVVIDLEQLKRWKGVLSEIETVSFNDKEILKYIIEEIEEQIKPFL